MSGSEVDHRHLSSCSSGPLKRLVRIGEVGDNLPLVVWDQVLRAGTELEIPTMGIARQINDLLRSQLRAYDTRRALTRLSDRNLADLGLERDLIPEVAALAARHGRPSVSLAEISAMAAQALLNRQTTPTLAPSPLANLLGTAKSARLATAD